jgi:hypothetical protein
MVASRSQDEDQDVAEDRGPVQDGAWEGWEPHESPGKDQDRREDRRKGRRRDPGHPERPERGTWGEREPRRGYEAVPEGWSEDVRRPLEYPTTDKCDKTDYRLQVAGVMRSQGRHLEADRYLACGRVVQDVCGDCGHKAEPRVWRCGLRECPECARREAGERFQDLIRDMRTLPAVPGFAWKHVVFTLDGGTLTLREGAERCREGMSRVVRWFRRARFKFGVSGFYGLEFGPKTGRAHVHMIVYAPYLAVDDLAGIWKEGNVRLFPVTSERQVENVTLYAVDFTDPDASPVFVASVGHALKGMRRVARFGKLYGMKSRKVRKARVCPCCSGNNLLVEWIEAPVEVNRESGPPN